MKPQPESEAISFERAKRDPASVFRVPEEVIDHAGFTPAEKQEILKAWVQDATRLSSSESEGMAGGEPAMLGRVLEALHCVENSLECGEPRPDRPPG